jgi:hypothetical protein
VLSRGGVARSRDHFFNLANGDISPKNIILPAEIARCVGPLRKLSWKGTKTKFVLENSINIAKNTIKQNIDWRIKIRELCTCMYEFSNQETLFFSSCVHLTYTNFFFRMKEIILVKSLNFEHYANLWRGSHYEESFV